MSTTQVLSPNWQYHFLGVGGISMSALALELHRRKFYVSGSDIAPSAILTSLENAGIKVQVGHDSQSLKGADAVVFSSALKNDNPIWQEVEKLGLPKFHRSEMLAALAKEKILLAITGTHGKTTSTAALAFALADCDPLVFLGGSVGSWAGIGNLKSGAGSFCICEADESDGSLLQLAPQAILLTNVEADHLDVHGTLAKLENTLLNFLKKLPPDGVLAYNLDDAPTRALVAQLPALRSVSFGSSKNADIRFECQELGAMGMEITLHVASKKYQFCSQLRGNYNAANLAGAFALAYATSNAIFSSVSLPTEKIIMGLKAFDGVERRQQELGSLGKLKIMDDYAHHPTEIQKTLLSLKELYEGPLVVIFQPHLYSRTKQFAKEFAQALSLADDVVLVPIYAAREPPSTTVSSADIARCMNKKPQLVNDWKELIPQLLAKRWQEGLLVTMGAGDITDLGHLVLAEAVKLKSNAAKLKSNAEKNIQAKKIPTKKLQVKTPQALARRTQALAKSTQAEKPAWADSLQDNLPNTSLSWHEPLANKNSLRVGGTALCLVDIGKLADLQALMYWLGQQEIPWWVLGKGSNVLIKDEGLIGVVIRLRGMQDFSNDGNLVWAEAGLANASFVEKCKEAYLGGMEFLSVIPGSIGGAITMNAGAHGCQTASFLSRVWLCALGGKTKQYNLIKNEPARKILPKKNEINQQEVLPRGFGYRCSPFQAKNNASDNASDNATDNAGANVVIYAAEFNLQKTIPAEAKKRQQAMLAWRSEHHPKVASCGSVFKNPPQQKAAQLIDKAGLKGLTLGGAQVSTQHANFIINKDKASATDVIQLIKIVQERVLQHSGFKLEREVCLIP